MQSGLSSCMQWQKQNEVTYADSLKTKVWCYRHPGRELLSDVWPEWHLQRLVQLCRAVRHLHANGVLHCDIKPANCLLSSSAHEEDILKVADFGLACKMTDSPDKWR